MSRKGYPHQDHIGKCHRLMPSCGSSWTAIRGPVVIIIHIQSIENRVGTCIRLIFHSFTLQYRMMETEAVPEMIYSPSSRHKCRRTCIIWPLIWRWGYRSKAKLYGMGMTTIQSQYNEKAKRASRIYVTTYQECMLVGIGCTLQ